MGEMKRKWKLALNIYHIKKRVDYHKIRVISFGFFLKFGFVELAKILFPT